MRDEAAGQVVELERRLQELEERSVRQSAALRAELARVQRVQQLEAQLHELEARQAAEAAALREALARAREQVSRAGETVPSGEAVRATSPQLLPVLLAYQVPTLLLAMCLVVSPLFVVFAAPAAVILLLSGLVGYGLERRRARLGRPSSLARTVLRHQTCPFVLVQPLFFAYAYFAGTFSFSGAHRLRLDDFALALALFEGSYLIVVVLPLLVLALRIHSAERG